MSQLTKKFIADNAVDGAKLRLLNNQVFRSRKQDNSADVDILKITTSDTLEFLTQPRAAAALPVPNSPKDYITVEYIENVILGKQDAKDSVWALADTDQALTGTAPLIIDDMDLGSATETSPLRISLAGQAAPADNGIYIYTVSAGDYTLSRASDFDASNEVTNGVYFKVVSGTVYSGYEVILTTPDPIVLGTTALTFAKYPSTLSITAGDMLKKVGNDLTIDLATVSGLESSNPGNATGQLRVRVDQAALEKDKSTKLDTGTNALIAKRGRSQSFTLSATDITNQYLDLDYVATEGSVILAPVGAGRQTPGVDYTVNYTGGAGSKTRVTFAGGLATGGNSALIATDVVVVDYESF